MSFKAPGGPGAAPHEASGPRGPVPHARHAHDVTRDTLVSRWRHAAARDVTSRAPLPFSHPISGCSRGLLGSGPAPLRSHWAGLQQGRDSDF